MENKWEILSGCADFNIIFGKIKAKYADDYTEKLDEIERQIQYYLDSPEEEWQTIVENGEVPYAVQWYVGMLNTETFLYIQFDIIP